MSKIRDWGRLTVVNNTVPPSIFNFCTLNIISCQFFYLVFCTFPPLILCFLDSSHTQFMPPSWHIFHAASWSAAFTCLFVDGDFSKTWRNHLCKTTAKRMQLTAETYAQKTQIYPHTSSHTTAFKLIVLGEVCDPCTSSPDSQCCPTGSVCVVSKDNR